MGKKSTRGRPEFQVTAALKRKVANAAGGGMSHEEIALGLGISRKTLEKHFSHELSVGAYQKRLDVLDAMQRTARKGNVAAQKAYLQLTPHVAAPPHEGSQPQETSPAAEAKLGKKEQAESDAITAQDGSKWEGLLPRSPGSSGLH